MDLYEQFETIQQQCATRSFSQQETIDIMRLCIYACLAPFPKRTATLPLRDHVLTSVRNFKAPRPTDYPLSVKLNTPSQLSSGGLD